MRLNTTLLFAGAALAAAAIGGACTGNECDKAADRATECGFQPTPDQQSVSAAQTATIGSTGPMATEVRDCTEVLSCQASCFNQAAALSCDAVTGKDAQGYASYVACLRGCN